MRHTLGLLQSPLTEAVRVTSLRYDVVVDAHLPKRGPMNYSTVALTVPHDMDGVIFDVGSL